MLSPEEIEAWEFTDEQKENAEAFERVKARARKGVTDFRLVMPVEERAVVAHAMLLEELLSMTTDALAEMYQQQEEARRWAVGVFDRHGNPSE